MSSRRLLVEDEAEVEGECDTISEPADLYDYQSTMSDSIEDGEGSVVKGDGSLHRWVDQQQFAGLSQRARLILDDGSDDSSLSSGGEYDELDAPAVGPGSAEDEEPVPPLQPPRRTGRSSRDPTGDPGHAAQAPNVREGA